MLVAAAARRLREVALMTKLSRAVIACISAMIMSAGVASSAHATTFTYLLDNNTLADANGGPSLVSYGGTLSNGYTFGVQQGLSLSGTGAFDSYSIDVHFRFDNINASFDGYQRILDFKNRALDEGLYSLNGELVTLPPTFIQWQLESDGRRWPVGR
jgi:hypothetical protein